MHLKKLLILLLIGKSILMVAFAVSVNHGDFVVLAVLYVSWLWLSWIQ